MAESLKRLALVALTLAAMLFALNPAAAQTAPTSDCTVTYGTNNAAGSHQLPSLRVYGSGETQIWSGTGYANGATSPAFACNSNRAVVFEMTKANGNQYRTGGSGWTMQFSDGATLRRDGANNFFFKPPTGFSGTYTLKGPVTVTSDPNNNFVYTGTSFNADNYQTGSSMAITQGGTTQPGVDQFEYLIQVTVVAAPTISGFTPTAGPTTGGGSITIGGNNFSASGNSVTIGGVAATITAQSTTSITATIPAGTAGAKAVVVTTSAADGSQSVTAGTNYTYVTPPTVTQLSATAGPPSGGGTVQLSGTDFTGATSVAFGGTTYTVSSAAPSSSNAQFVSNVRIDALAPAGTAGTTVNARVTTPGGQSATGAGNQYAYTNALTNAVQVGTTPITTGGTSQLTFTITNPAANPAVSGITSTVTLPGGVVVAPTPNASTTCTGGVVAATAGGSTIALTANSLAAGNNCTFTAAVTSNTAATYTISSGAADSTQTDPGTATTAQLVVNNPTPPTVSSIDPTGGSTGGGTPVTITGANFVSGHTYSATFGTATVQAAYASATTLTATTPAGTGTVQVTVIDTTTSQAGTGGANYAYAAPTVTGLSVTSGAANAQKANVVVTGTNFTPTASVAIGGTAVTTAQYNSATQLTVTLPAKAAGTYDVQVTTGAATSAANPPADQYTYVALPAAPVVTAPANNSSINTATPTFSGTFDGTSTSVAVYVDGALRGNATLSGTTWSYALTGAPLSQGTRTAYAVASNGGGSTQGPTVTFTVDTIPPAAPVITSPAQNANVTTATPTITGTAEANSSVRVTIDGTTGTPVTADGSGNFSYTSAALAKGAHSATATTTDAAGNVSPTGASRTFTYTTVPTVTSITPNQGATTGGQSVTIAGTGFTGVNPATGLKIGANTATGVTVVSDTQITATTPAGAAGSASVNATNAAGSNPANTLYTYVAPLAITSGPVTGATVGGAYSQTNAASGGTTPYVYAVAAGMVPAGTTLNTATGMVTGTPMAAGAFSYAVKATDANGAGTTVTGTTVSGTIAQGSQTITYTSTAPANATVGGAYTVTATASSGLAVAFSIEPASNGICTISGNTVSFTAAGTCTIDADQAGNANYAAAQQKQQAVTVGKAAQTITYTSTPPANATAGGATYTVSATASSGLAVTFTSATTAVCTIAGNTVSFVGAGTCTINANQAGNANYNAAAQTPQSFTVAAPTITTGPPTLPGGTVNQAYSQTLTASGGASPYSYSATGTLPTGLTLTPGGILSGTPTAAGSFTFTVTARDANNFSSPARQYTVTIVDMPPTANGQSVTTPFNTAAQITLTGSNAASYTIATNPAHGSLSGTMPNLTYTPASTPAPGYQGTDSFTFYTSNSAGNSAPATVSITVQGPAPTVSTVSPNQGSTAGGTTITINGSGFTGATGVTVGGGAATNVAVVSDAQITARTPAGAAGAASVVVTNATGSNPANTAFTYATPPTANGQGVTTAYNTAKAITLTANGSGTITYAIATNPAHGMLSGTAPNLTYTPTTGYRGADSFTFTASNGGGQSAPATVSITVGDPTIAVSGTPAAGTRGAAYSAQLTASGGTAPYAFAVAPGGALPPGLTIASSGSTGTISGTPTASGSFQFALTVTDSSNPAASATTPTYTISVGAPASALSPPAGALPGGTVGVAYSQTITTAGAGTTAPYTYAVTGTLPAGMSFTAGGVLSGTPTMAGDYAFQVTSTDSSTAASGGPYTTTANYTLHIGGAQVTVLPAGGFPNGKIGVAYSQQASASGGTGPYTFTLASGALPEGLMLASDGTISGTPREAGGATFTLEARDSSTGTGAPFHGQRQYTLTIDAPTITIAPDVLANGSTNIQYSQQFTASGGTAPYTYAATGNVPTGLVLASTGTLSGTPTQTGNYTFTVKATDSSTGTGSRFSQSRSYTVTIAAPAIAVAPASLPGAKVGAAYSQTLTASGGSGGYAYAVAVGTLPDGLTLTTGGVLSGTPTAGGSFSFTVKATDGNGNSGTTTYNGFTVAAPTIVVAPDALADATTNVAYSQSLTASGGTASYTYQVTAGALPTGITLAANGVLSGKATTAGQYGFSVTARDGSGGTGPYTSAAKSYTLTVVAPTITIAPAALPDATTRVSYSQQLTASGGSGAYGYAVTAGALPTGITLSTGGLLSGKANAAGQATFTVTATDANGNQGAKGYTLTVAAPAIAIAPAALPDATTRVSYSQQLTATGGTGPYGYVVTAGALPAGITLSPGGLLSGKATAAGQFTFTVTATDGNGNTGAKGYTLTVIAPAITIAPAALPDAVTRVAYSQQLTASGGNGAYGYAVTAGALPAGITLSTGGLLSGKATAAGQATFTVTATDADGNTGAKGYTLTVAAPAIAIAPATLPDATTRVGYSQQLSASGGNGAYAYAVTAGALPAGITLSTGGLLSGKATAAGQATFTVTATDADGNAGAKGYTLTVAAPAITLAPQTLPGATTNIAYGQALTATGGTGPYAYAVTAGALPAGITLAADGTLSGKPTAAGQATFTVTATDADGNKGAQGYTLTVAAPAITLAPQTLPAPTVGVAYGATITASGGTAPYGYAVTAGALPTGITLSTGGALSGTPTAGGTFGFTVTATDADGNQGARGYSVTVAAPTIAIAPDTLPNATTNIAYRQVLTASGGTATYTYAVTAGALPAGVTLGTDGTLSGKPTQAGTYGFSVTARDSSTGSGPYTSPAKGYTLTVAAPAITLAPQTLPGATTNIAYSQALTATGGTGPYGYAVTAGALPAGITLAADGTLSGKPTAAGQSTFTVTATDANGNKGAQGYTLTVAAPAITLAPQTLPAPTVGAAYGATITASGGTAPYGYAVTAGALPTGVTLSTGGALSGTPTAGGTFGFTVTATDADGNQGARGYSVTVAAPTIAIAPDTLPSGQSGVAYNQALTASGGTAPYKYAVTAGTLPAGLTLSAGGALTGTPTASGSFAFTVAATDSSAGSGPYTGTRNYTLAIAAPTLEITPASIPGATVGTAYSQALTTSGGTAPYGYAVTAGALPAGVTLAANGTLSGTPTAGGSFAFTVTATDATDVANGGPYTASRGYTLQVAAPTVTVTPAALPDGQYQVAYSQTLTATGGTAPYAYAVTAGALPAGVTLTSTGALSGTPTAFGSFTFTVTATDGSTGTGPYMGTRGYTLRIAPPATPTAGNVAATVAYGSANNQVALQLGGGTADSVAVSTAPTHGTATASGTTITYTPAAGYAGTDSFTYTATNGGGTSAPGTVSVTVSSPTLTLAPSSLPAGQQDVAYSQQLTAGGGAAPYAYALTAGRLPNGVTLSSGGLVAGTPRESGSFTVTVRATDSSTGSGPFTATASYTLQVALPAPPVARGGAASVAESTTVQNGSVSIDLSALVTGNYASIRIATQPQHGTVSIDAGAQQLSQTGQRTIATYTPAVGYVGADGFGYVAVGAGGNSNEARVAVTVTGVAPVAASVKASVTNGQTTNVDLTGGAFGGPFTAATIVSVSPANSVDAALVEGGGAGNRTYLLRVTPIGRFSGTATVTYTLANAYGTSAPATVTVTVAQRADPSLDPTVTGISAAEAEATRRFAQAQLDNFQRRNEQLHHGGAGSQGSPMGISVGSGIGLPFGGGYPGGPRPQDSVVALKMEHATAVMGAERAAGLLSLDRNGQPMAVSGLAGARGRSGHGTTDGTGAPSGRAGDARGLAGGGDAATPRDPAAPGEVGDEAIEGNGRKVGSAALWSGGAITIGSRDATTRRAKMTVSTGGLSAGVDVKLSEALTLGVGGGYGADRTKVGGDKGRVDGDSWMGAAYGSLSPADGLFIDGIAGGGHLSFDTIRTVTGGNGAIARGHRGGSMVFGSLTGGFDRTSATHALSAYGRVDYLSADLDRYAETGAGTADLAFDHRDLTSLSSVLGLRGSVVAGAFVPRLRAEWRHEFKDGGVQALDYADLSGFTYAIRGDGWLRDDYSVELGTDYILESGWRLGIDIGGALGRGSRFATGKVTIRKQF